MDILSSLKYKIDNNLPMHYNHKIQILTGIYM